MKNQACELAFDRDVQDIVGVDVLLVEIGGWAVFEALIVCEEEPLAVLQEVIHSGLCHDPHLGMIQSSTLN